MEFRLMIAVTEQSGPFYPYVAVSEQTDRLINISTDRIEILKREDAAYFEEDYMSTSRCLEVDLAEIDRLVKDYIGPFEFRMLVNLNEHKHMVLTYHSPTNEAPKDYDIFDGYPEKRARDLVDTLFPVFVKMRDEAEIIER